MMKTEELNNLSEAALKETLQKCCGSSSWIHQMIRSKPFLSPEDLFSKADVAWKMTNENDWLEAFSHHPKIGDLKSLEKKFAATKSFAGSEQASVNSSSQKILEDLAAANTAYEKKFGFIFIVCATGKSAGEMLSLLKSRINNSRDAELKIASLEQHKITKLRLQKTVS